MKASELKQKQAEEFKKYHLDRKNEYIETLEKLGFNKKNDNPTYNTLEFNRYTAYVEELICIQFNNPKPFAYLFEEDKHRTYDYLLDKLDYRSLGAFEDFEELITTIENNKDTFVPKKYKFTFEFESVCSTVYIFQKEIECKLRLATKYSELEKCLQEDFPQNENMV